MCSKCFIVKEHTKYHMFLKLDKPLINYEMTTPVSMIKFLDEGLYPISPVQSLQIDESKKKKTATQDSKFQLQQKISRGVSREYQTQSQQQQQQSSTQQ